MLTNILDWIAEAMNKIPISIRILLFVPFYIIALPISILVFAFLGIMCGTRILLNLFNLDFY